MSVAKLVSNATIKRSALAAFFALMTLSAQGQDQRVSVEMKNKSLSALFSTLEKQAKVSIDFAVNQVNVKQNITVDMQNQPIGEVLKKVLPALGYTYEFKGDHVIVKPRAAVIGKMKQITGVVMDTNNEPLMGANIAVPETGTIAITDIDGKYTIFAPDEATLVYSYIGFAPQEVKIKGRKNFNIFLAEDQKALDEVVVTGFQTISRERASGSAVIVNKEKLNQIKSPDIVSNLEGLVPGLNTQGGMSIRGSSSLSLSSQPLIVIDGMPVENISNFYAGTSTTGLGLVNPEDIENITVLKDAAATSLYGVRAANGVIVVTTKKGTSQKPVVSFSANYYITPDAGMDYMKYASTADILNYEVEYMTNDPIYKDDPLEYFTQINSTRSPGYVTKVKDLYYQKALGNLTQGDVDAQLNQLRGRDYRKEYLDHFAKSSFSQDYNLSVSQGSDFAQTYFSARFQDNRPNSIDATSNRIGLNLNNTFNLAKWVKLTSGISVNIDNSKNKNLSYVDYYFNNQLYSATTFMPYDQIIDDNGQRSVLYPFNMYRSQELAENSEFQHMGYNPYDDLESGSSYKNRDVYLKFLANAEFKIIKDLTFDLRFQYEHINGKTEAYSSVKSYEMRELINRFTSIYDDGYNQQAVYNVPKGGKLSESDKQLQNMNLRGQFNYSTVFNEKHALSALAGFELRENKIRFTAHDRFGYDDQLLSYQFVDWASLSQYGVLGLLTDVTQKLSPNMNISDAIHRYVSGYFNAGYTYDGRYSGTVSVRMDQADLFGTDPKYRYRPLWSVGGSWNASNEAFMQPLSWINMLKFRVTYGITGNVDQNSTPFLIGDMIVSSETGGTITEVMTPPNKLLRWEKTSTFNFGIDFAAWNRLNASVDVYKKYSSDLLAPKRYDPSMGFDQGWVNNGAMSNRGIEFSGSYDWIKTKNWRFSSELTAAYNKNEIKKIDYEPTNALDLLRNPNEYYLTGTSRGTMYAYKYVGLNENGDPVVLDENGQEVSNDPVRDINSVYAVGQLAPKWQGMLNLSVQYKNFELFTRFVYYTGHNMRYDVMPLYQGIGGGDIHRDIVNRWTPSNQGNIPAIGKYGDDPNRGDHWKFADDHILTASYIRARNIGLTYTVPQSFLQKIGFKSAVLRAQVDNPFYISFNGKGLDPESYDLNGGVRYNKIMPTYTFGLNVSF